MSLRRRALRPVTHLWLRVAHPSWTDPLDGTFAARHGGRWNPPDSWPTLYLCRDLAIARAQIARLLAGSPADPEDLTDDAYVLVGVRLPPSDMVDVVTAGGVRAAGLPDEYPSGPDGRIVPHETCQAIGERAHAEGADGIEARSAVASAGTEVAWWPIDGGQATPVATAAPYGRWRRGDVADVGAVFGTVVA